MGNDLLSGFGRHSDPCFDILFCSLLAADAALVPQELLRRESSEFSPMVKDPFYVVSAGARWVCVHVPCVTAGPALASPACSSSHGLSRAKTCTNTATRVLCTAGLGGVATSFFFHYRH